jgi:hypothetical protein
MEKKREKIFGEREIELNKIKIRAGDGEKERKIFRESEID